MNPWFPPFPLGSEFRGFNIPVFLLSLCDVKKWGDFSPWDSDRRAAEQREGRMREGIPASILTDASYPLERYAPGALDVISTQAASHSHFLDLILILRPLTNSVLHSASLSHQYFYPTDTSLTTQVCVRLPRAILVVTTVACATSLGAFMNTMHIICGGGFWNASSTIPSASAIIKKISHKGESSSCKPLPAVFLYPCTASSSQVRSRIQEKALLSPFLMTRSGR